MRLTIGKGITTSIPRGGRTAGRRCRHRSSSTGTCPQVVLVLYRHRRRPVRAPLWDRCHRLRHLTAQRLRRRLSCRRCRSRRSALGTPRLLLLSWAHVSSADAPRPSSWADGQASSSPAVSRRSLRKQSSPLRCRSCCCLAEPWWELPPASVGWRLLHGLIHGRGLSQELHERHTRPRSRSN